MKKMILFAVGAVAAALLIAVPIVHKSRNTVPTNPNSASGNLSGNLYNGGYFCEYEGDIYYSNLSDQYQLYKIKANGEIEREKQQAVFSINIYNGYLYYSKNAVTADRESLTSRPYGIYRVELKSGDTRALTDSLAPYSALCGNTILFQEYTDTSLYFSKVNIEDGKETRIKSTGYVVACVEDGYLYYAEQEENHNIYRYNPVTGNKEMVHNGNCYQPIVMDGMLYYIDLKDGYSLKKLSLQSGEQWVISKERCINYNTNGQIVYFEVEDSPSGAFGLYRCDVNGNNLIQISDQPCKDINITSEYTYFTYFFDDEVWYRVPTNGEPIIERFDIVLEEK